MSNITDFDPNFKVETKLEQDGIRFYDPLHAPFIISGVFKEDGHFRRMPAAIAETVSPGVRGLSMHTAGGRVRFRTDSPYVAISTVFGDDIGKMPHFAFTGAIGYDLYVDGRYHNTFVPPIDIGRAGYESISYIRGERQMREIVVNMPLYTKVDELYIGLDEHATIEAPTPYVNDKPVVYYGSSITQGGCASRPGMAYESILERRFNCDYINLGFSGSAKGEDAMIDYLAGLDMSVFVCDYDHNAPTAEHLRNTHEKLFSAVRATHPDIPIIIMTSPNMLSYDEWPERRHIIETTFRNAVAAGDKDVYFLDGFALMAQCGNEGTVDTCHPTDYGFASMAAAVGGVMERGGFFR